MVGAGWEVITRCQTWLNTVTPTMLPANGRRLRARVHERVGETYRPGIPAGGLSAESGRVSTGPADGPNYAGGRATPGQDIGWSQPTVLEKIPSGRKRTSELPSVQMPASIADQRRAKATEQDKDPEIPTRRDQSAALVTIVAVFYALVLGQCLIQQPTIFLHPGANKTAALAMGVVFVGAAWEFLTYSLNMGRFPYKVRWVTASNTATEELRFGVDLLVATTYALLLIQAYGLSLNPSLKLFWFFGTLVLIDLLSLGGVLLGRVQWHIPRYRLFAELPFTLGLLVWYDLDNHSPSAALNQHFLTYAIGFIFLRELCVRFAAKQHFASSRGVETFIQRLRRRLTRAAPPSQPTAPLLPVYLAGPLGFFPYGAAFYDHTLIPVLREAGFGVLTPVGAPRSPGHCVPQRRNGGP